MNGTPPKGAPRPARDTALAVEPPYRAEHPKKRLQGEERPYIEDAMADGRAMGVGARVVSRNGVVLARFENVSKLGATAFLWPTNRSRRRGRGRPPKAHDDEFDELIPSGTSS